MYFMSLSAVQRSVSAGGSNLLKKLIRQTTKRKMSNWQEQKEKFMKMDMENKRQHYRMKDFKTLEDIATWPEYAARKGAALYKITKPLKDVQINQSKNAEIAPKVSIYRGDITALEIDAIVNAANESLMGGGGVDGAIHRAAGTVLKEECKTLGGCPEGEAKITSGYKLPAKHIIHTVGPKGEKPNILQSCYKKCLQVMLDKKLRTIAFPCVSTGIYGYPLEPAAHIATYEVRKALEQHSDKIDRVIFCLFTEQDQDIYEGVMQSYFPLH